MSPALPDLLVGAVASLMTPPPPEAGGDYAAARTGLLAALLLLAAQEAERGPAARLAENEAIAALLGESGAAIPAPAEASWSALDARNAALRTALIGLHEAAEARRDAPLQRRILALYEAMALGRRLELPAFMT